MGEISDGIVSESQMDGYSFEAFPKGNFYGREQDFKIYFANEKLYISWADTCEYTLTRGDGSADSVQEHRGNIEESGLLDSVISVVDSNYADFEHSVFYDEDNRSLYIYIQGMDNLIPQNLNRTFSGSSIWTKQHLNHFFCYPHR